jgi:hypothetical protein
MENISEKKQRINDLKEYPSEEERTSVYKNEFKDYKDLKKYINKLEEIYPNFITLQSAFFEKDLKSNYLMADKDFNNFRHFEINEDKEIWKIIHPQEAKDLLEQFYFSNKIDEWNLDKIIDKSENQVSNKIMKNWMDVFSNKVDDINNLNYEDLKVYTEQKKLDRRFLSEDVRSDHSINVEIEYLNKSLRYLETNVNKEQFELLETLGKSEFYSKYHDSNKGTLVDYTQLQKEFQDSSTPRKFINKVLEYTKDINNSKIDLKELLKQDGINIVDDFSNKKEVIKNQYKNTPKINRDVEKKTFKLKEKPNSKNQEQER